MEHMRNQDPYLSRSLSMSIAVQWKREHVKIISLTALVAVIVVSVLILLFHGLSTKQVTLVMDGQERKIATQQWIMKRFLDEQGISLGEHDHLSASPDSQISSGVRIVIQHSVPIQLTANGVTRTVFTTGTTVESVLQDLNISLGNHDKITPDLHTQVSTNLAVNIVRVKKMVDETAQPIQYQVIKKYDASLPAGKEQTVQDGKEGLLVQRKVTTYEDGALISEQILDQSVKSQSVNKIVAIGTKKSTNTVSISSVNDSEDSNKSQVSNGGLNFPVKRILNDVTLTAYTAGVASTGKSSGDPQFGLTATGTHVSEGRTIAVDPNIIPLGWWVYIDGIGFRRAEDTGSAIKGQKIDVYYNNESFARQFGLKHGVTVYVIGPEKPSLE